MKKTLSLFLAIILIIGMMPLQALAEATSSTETKVESVEPVVEDKDALEIGDEVQPEPVGEGAITIKRVGQWTNDCTMKSNKDKTYNSLDDHIGMPPVSGGLLRKFAKVFIGWSDMAPVLKEREIEGEKVTCQSLADGATLFSPEDTVKTYQDYVKNVKAKKGSKYTGDENTIYAVYYEINGFNEPLDSDAFKAINQVFGNIEALKASANDNTLKVCEKDDAKSIVKTEIKEDNRNKGTNKADIIGKYKGEDIELGLESEFIMDDSMAMLAYRNEAGTNALRPILSYDYNTRYKNKDFPTEGEKQNYTYVDLNMDFGEDEGLVIPEELFLEFKSYSWRPLYAFGIKPDGKKDVLNNLDDYKDLVSGSNPKTTFSVNTKYKTVDGKDKNYRKITIRVVLREWDNSVDKPSQNPFSGERIPEKIIPKGPEGTIASEILTNMTLRVLGSKDGKDFVKITKEKAKELADSSAIKKIEIKGTVEGQVYLNVSGFGVPVPINTVKSNDFSISLIKDEPKPEPQPEPKPEPQPEYNPFWPIYFGSIKKAEEVKDKEIHKAYIFGYTDKTVKGNGNLTRAEAAAMVTRLAGLDLSDKSKADYKDLQDGAWYLPNINAALKADMIDATDNNLRPNDKITRGEFAKMLAAIDKDNDYVSSFSDIKGHKYEKEISKIDGNKRIEGYQDGTFKPDGFLTRAEAASFLNRMFNRVADDVAIEDYVNSIIAFEDLSKNDWFYFEIVEATNTHELYRRGGSDKFERAFEKWTNVLN